MSEIPQTGQKWRRKTDHSKVLTVTTVLELNNFYESHYVYFDAPWMKAQSGCWIDVFHKRYEPVPH